MKYLKTFENLNNGIEVWRGSRSDKLYDGMFFSKEKEYSRIFGYTEKYLIYPEKILDLFKYNAEIKERILKMKSISSLMNIENYLNMHRNAIADCWATYLDYLYVVGLEDLVDRFIDEFEVCDCIYGPDAGFPDSQVYYMKKKEQVEKIK